MAMFGKFPPWGKKQPEESESRSEHIVSAQKPAELDVPALMHLLREGGRAKVAEELEEYGNNWILYAQGQGVGSKSSEVWKAQREILPLLDAYASDISPAERGALEQRIQEGLTSLHERPAAIETAIAERERSQAEPEQSSTDINRMEFAENKQDMRGAVHQIEVLQAGNEEARSDGEPKDGEVIPIVRAKTKRGKGGADLKLVASNEPEDLDSDLELKPEQELSVVKQEWHERLAKRAGVSKERKAAQAALEAREEPFQDYLRAEAKFNKIKKKNLTDEDIAEFEAARAAYEGVRKSNVDAQLAYVGKLQTSVKERLLKRGISGERADQILARYNKLIRVREIVIPAKEQEQKIRENLLEEKGRNIFQKFSKWNKAITDKTESAARSLILKAGWGKKMNDVQLERAARITGRAARLLGFATIGTAGGLVASALLGGPAAAALLAAAGGRVAYGIGSTAVGGVAGYGLGKRFEATKGKKRKMEFEAAQTKEITSEEDLLEQRKAFDTGGEKALKEARIKRENLGALLTSFSAAGATIAAEGGFTAIGHAATWMKSILAGEQPAGAAFRVDLPIHDVPPVNPAGTFSNVHVDSVSVHGHVNDADRLFGRFMDNVNRQFPDPHRAPPALRTLMEQFHRSDGMHQQDVLTRALHLQDGRSVTVHEGDTVSFENGEVRFQGHTLVDRDGTIHNLRTGNEIHVQQHPVGHAPHTAVPHATPHAAPTHTPEHARVTSAPPREAVEQPAPATHPQTPEPAPAPRVEAVPTQHPPTSAAPQERVTIGHEIGHEHPQEAAVPAPESHTQPSAHPVEAPPAANDNVPHPSGAEHATAEVPVHAETQPTATAPVAPPTIEHAITNRFGVHIDPTTPHVYTLNGSNGQMLVLYGGTSEARQAILNQYLENYDDFGGRPLLMPAVDPSDPQHRQVLLSFGMDQNRDQVVPIRQADARGRVLYFNGPDDLQTLIN